MQFKNIIALVPMRHHSQRVPQKNFREIAGKPLYHHIITTLQSCSQICKIVVNTDSDVILEGLESNFPSVIRIKRPPHLCADTVPMNDILLHDVDQVKGDLYLQTHSTNPLLKAETISKAITQFRAHSQKFDSLFSVTRMHTRLWDQNAKPINHDPNILLRTQDLPPVFEENSCIYMFTAQNLKKRKNRLGENPMIFEIDPQEALDIDEEYDFQIADIMLRMQQNSKLV